PKLKTAPVCQSLASQVTKILLSPGFSWSITIRQSALMTRALMASKAYWSLAVQGGKFRWASFMVNRVKMVVWSASFGRKAATYLTSPKKEQTLLAFRGTCQFRIFSTLEE